MRWLWLIIIAAVAWHLTDIKGGSIMGKGATYWGNAEGHNRETETKSIINGIYDYPTEGDMSKKYPNVTNETKTGGPDSQVVPQVKA